MLFAKRTKNLEHGGLMDGHIEKLSYVLLVGMEFFNCNELCLTDRLYKVFDGNKTTPCNDVILRATSSKNISLIKTNLEEHKTHFFTQVTRFRV